MSDYDRIFFDGECPYTGKHCDDWNCNECEVEKSEQEYTQEMRAKE